MYYNEVFDICTYLLERKKIVGETGGGGGGGFGAERNLTKFSIRGREGESFGQIIIQK